MNIEQDQVIGIVGGMGPQSGLALFNRILCNTKATMDQNHLSTILISFPKYIGDRTQFLEGVITVNPAFNIVKIIERLESSGVKVAGMACNTSHSPEIYDVILNELEKMKSQVKLLNMPYETCKHIKNNHPNVKRVGLMTTNGTYKSKIYKKLLEQLAYDVVIPDFKFQNNIIHKMIYDLEFGIKSNPDRISNEVKSLLSKAFAFFKENNTDAIILGCTELSIVFSEKVIDDMIIVDSIDTFASALIREATNKS